MLPTTTSGLRCVQSDATIRGYNVPAGTAVMWSFMLIGKDPKMFPEPGKSSLLKFKSTTNNLLVEYVGIEFFKSKCMLTLESRKFPVLGEVS